VGKLSNLGGSGCLALFALPFAGVGVGMLWLAIPTVAQSRAAAEWVETPCKILSAEMEVSRGSDSTSYKCVARYSYQFNGRGYESERVSFSKGSDNIGSFQQDCLKTIRARKRAGTSICYVNPDEPSSSVIFRGVRWGMIGFYMIFVLTFGGVGFGLLIFSVFGARLKKKEGVARLQNPGQPWLWRPEWQSGTIKSTDKKGMIALLCFTLFWNLISFPVGFMAFSEGYLKDGQKGALLALLFPLVGTFLIIAVVCAVLRYRKYGATTLQLASTPGVIGGKLAGIIHVPVHIVPEDGFSVRLRCIHRYTTGSGKSRSTHEDTRWEDYRKFSTELLATDYTRTALPVLFAVPYDAEESNVDAGEDGIHWRVEAEAKTRGIDFKTTFDVPVFRTEESSEDFVLDESSIKQYEAEVSPDDLLQQHKLVVEPIPGGICWRFPAARQKKHAIGLTLFFTLWTAAIVAMLKFGAPILFPIAFGFFDLFLAWAFLDMWLISSRVEITHRTVTVTRGVFGLGIPKVIPLKDVQDIEIKRGMQSGNTVFYGLKLVTDEGKSILLGNQLLGSKDVAALASRLTGDLLGEE